jgi:hypothetical protein
MRVIDPERYEQVIAAAGLKKKFVSELRPKFASIEDWDEREFVPITDRSGNRGILWIDLDDEVYILPYTLTRGIVDKASGRARPVICDLCMTQQPGTLAGRLHITMPASPDASRGLLCCADLACSAHVRGKTMSSLRSKAQLREGLSPEARIERLQNRLAALVKDLDAQPIE